eukprot:TRINITY_DN26714_c0_g1_i1.p1 TRINITY_DN26714_c0_g1~~TRINITY_DN26714_c0_g1_i1.p1  ORF type:complete len:147 (+),score=30.42 TRINITY_DN26714_c0_g1_i1:132-572(+)
MCIRDSQYPAGLRNNAGQALEIMTGKKGVMKGFCRLVVGAERRSSSPRCWLHVGLVEWLRAAAESDQFRFGNWVRLRDDVAVVPFGERGLAYYNSLFASRLKLLLVLGRCDAVASFGSPNVWWEMMMRGFVLYEAVRLVELEMSNP